ncbi:hypothetical protein GCM10007049_30070 [Echinicola pacifica]|uniref:BD-FAE-like domain-containing protein n=1 Tax=Echinicola pacifica TaxID=346377 RepID=A0A918Q680_9BACT|nr:alpha/beta hydrolase [Echinicola pacifica]GGZ34685.1 hypothetical protein GCM10007049_30070 [Echinicola pacifica]
MKSLLFFYITILFVLSNIALSSAQQTYPLYKGEAPHTRSLIAADSIGKGGRVTKVAVPQLIVYRPDQAIANGKAILICPGGGYGILAIEHEGYQIAEWYSQQGYTAAVLKYRLPQEDLLNESWKVPQLDAQQGLLFLRRKAGEWNYNTNQIGILGFSAGGHLASSASVHHETAADGLSTRPDFSILVYPVISMDTSITHQGSRHNLLGEKIDSEWESYYSNETQVNKDTPPAFLVHSWDDGAVPAENSIRYAKAVNQQGIQVELHLFEKGGHGYGAGNADQHGNAASWLALSHTWISDLFD